MPTHQSAASAINLVDKENEQAPRPVEAEALPGNAMVKYVWPSRDTNMFENSF